MVTRKKLNIRKVYNTGIITGGILFNLMLFVRLPQLVNMGYITTSMCLLIMLLSGVTCTMLYHVNNK